MLEYWEKLMLEYSWNSTWGQFSSVYQIWICFERDVWVLKKKEVCYCFGNKKNMVNIWLKLTK